MEAIRVENICKNYGKVQALKGLSFEVQQGELFGLLGPNGAGKTTTINILTGLARPDAGRYWIAGLDCTKHPRANQHLIGVVPDESNLYPELTGMENLCFCASLYGIAKKEREALAKDLLEKYGLWNVASRKFGTYSKGMKRKLTILAGIIHKPSILFLDEPTTGIDVNNAKEIRELILSLNASGTTILLTTHYLEEAERLCHRIAFIKSGKIIKVGNMIELSKQVIGFNMLQIIAHELYSSIVPNIKRLFKDYKIEQRDVNTLIVTSHNQIQTGKLVKYLEENGVAVLEAKLAKPTLEDIFIRITNTCQQDAP